MGLTPAEVHALHLPHQDTIRAHFPALSSPTAFLENAGGSQVPACVADAIQDYFLTSYVQLGAGYAEANRADETVSAAHTFVNRLMNGKGLGISILGPSTSQLLANLALSFAETLEPGDEIVVSEAGHEANVGPWLRLAKRGAQVRTWQVDPRSGDSPLATLEALVNERTRIVAVPHVSNLLGAILDVRAVAELVRKKSRARLVVDGVAFAPHRAIDVAALDVDFYAYSTYKVYGPHMAALFGRSDALSELTGQNHDFIPKTYLPGKFELGGVLHEGTAGLLALQPYLAFLAGIELGETKTARAVLPARSTKGLDGAAAPLEAPSAWLPRVAIEHAFAVMEACEAPLIERLIAYLREKPGVRIVGPSEAGPFRVGTISFVHATRSSAEIVKAAHTHHIGIRHGHMYAPRLCRALDIEPEDGVVRVSFVHYNTIEEIERLIDVLETVL